MTAFLEKIETSATFRFFIQFFIVIVFITTWYVTVNRDMEDSRDSIQRHDTEIRSLREAITAQNNTITNLISLSKSEKELQQLRNDSFNNSSNDHESRLRRLELRSANRP